VSVKRGARKRPEDRQESETFIRIGTAARSPEPCGCSGIRDKSIDDFATAIIIRTLPRAWQTAGDPETWSAQWATEILPLANAALTRVQIGPGELVTGGSGERCTWPVAHLERDYTRWANEQALVQLGKAASV